MNRMKNLNRAYRIPLFLFVSLLFLVHVDIAIIFLLYLSATVFFPALILVFVLPVLWVVGYFKKRKNAVLWSKVGLLSITASVLAPLISLLLGYAVHEHQLESLAPKLDNYKKEKGSYPKEIGEAVPFYYGWGIYYYTSSIGQKCTLSYSKRLSSVTYSSGKGTWERKVLVD